MAHSCVQEATNQRFPAAVYVHPLTSHGPAHGQGPWIAFADKDFENSSTALSALVTALHRLGNVAILRFVPRLNRVRNYFACM